jgi:hypothetical protein
VGQLPPVVVSSSSFSGMAIGGTRGRGKAWEFTNWVLLFPEMFSPRWDGPDTMGTSSGLPPWNRATHPESHIVLSWNKRAPIIVSSHLVIVSINHS